MLQILNKCLVTYKGIDFERLLVRDDTLNGLNPCDFCVYNEIEEYDVEKDFTCLDSHQCGAYDDDYFILRSCPKLKK